MNRRTLRNNLRTFNRRYTSACGYTIETSRKIRLIYHWSIGFLRPVTISLREYDRLLDRADCYQQTDDLDIANELSNCI